MARVTVQTLQQMKRDGRKIAAVLAADYRTAQIADRSDVDVVLVADSAGVNILGHRSARDTTLDEMVLLCRGARRGVQRAFLLADLPYGSSQVSAEAAVRSAVRLVKEGGADGVKLEGGGEHAPTVAAIARAGVPVMAHFGPTPQVQARLGGFEEARRAISDDALLAEAQVLEQAGAFALDLTMGGTATKRIVDAVRIPVLGGRGTTADSDGQFLQVNRLAGWSVDALDDDVPRYATAARVLLDALNAYAADVRGGALGKGRG
jgi:3-methyl-2-oxobutanoate hydroxymethyltransferase